MGKSKKLNTQDELHIQITKANGEVVLDEWGCTVVSYILNCRGEMARSFLGAHNSELIKILKQVQKSYIKQVAKAVSVQEKQDDKAVKVIKKKSKQDDKLLENVDLSKAQNELDEMSQEYGVDVQKILQEEIDKFKAEKKLKDEKCESMSDLDPSYEQQYKNAKKVGSLIEKNKKEKTTQNKKSTSKK